MNRRVSIGILCGLFVSAISVFTFYGLSLSGILDNNWFYRDWLGKYSGFGLISCYVILLALSAIIGYSIAKLHLKLLTAAGLTWILALSIFIALVSIAN